MLLPEKTLFSGRNKNWTQESGRNQPYPEVECSQSFVSPSLVMTGFDYLTRISRNQQYSCFPDCRAQVKMQLRSSGKGRHYTVSSPWHFLWIILLEVKLETYVFEMSYFPLGKNPCYFAFLIFHFQNGYTCYAS